MKRFALFVLAGLTACTSALGAGSVWGLPAVPIPRDNPITRAKIELGRKLFMDRRLSHNNTFSCAMCHVPEQGFTSNELGTAIGIEGQSTRRNSPTILNVAYVEQFFHDGREFSLENQIWGPLLAANEMGNPSIGYVVEKLRVLPDYRGLFEKAFGRGADMLAIGQAIASYERTVVAASSRFDQWHFRGKPDALSDTEKEGFRVFSGKGRCIACHTVAQRHALFSDGRFHNTGIGYARTMGIKTRYTVPLAPGVTTEMTDDDLRSFEPTLPDVGRYEVTLDPGDRWAYRTPTLRNVALTAPYMHDGSLASLEEVVEFYDRGGIDNENRDPLIGPLGLTAAEKTALVAFLKTLTGTNVGALARAARAAVSPETVPQQDPAATYRRHR
jgi:cytochrome c peroxidase